MSSVRVVLPEPAAPVLEALRRELGVVEQFPPAALAEAEQAARSPRLPGPDLTALPFVTIDPEGSLDLDQAVRLSRKGPGVRVRYAIADPASVVVPGGALDAELWRRGETLYAPDRRVPLHPTVLGEGPASLLPGVVRPAVHLPGLEQEVELGADGPPVLALRAPLPVQGWNAQVSLLSGSAAARTMLDGGVGLLRTMPDPPAGDVAALRRSALALGLPWPQGVSYGAAVSALDPAEPRAAALLVLATRLLRGAGYTAFDGEPPAVATHSAVAGPYAHATAPLRRLADRYVLQTCVALHAGEPVPADVRAALPRLPAVMAGADRAAHALDRAGIDLAEALVLAARVGERFCAQVVETGPKHGAVQLRDPAVRARCDASDLPLGATLDVVLVAADPVRRTVPSRPA